MRMIKFLVIRVFPTPVGVFPFVTWAKQIKISLPHARGGVSQKEMLSFDEALSSPRPWGCFSTGEKRQKD